MGYSADVEVVLDVRSDVLRVPTAALMQGGKVLVLEGDRLVERAVKTGVTNWEHSEITAGLTGGERIVTSLDRAGVKAGVAAVVDEAASAAK